MTAEVRIQVCVPAKRIYFNALQLDRLENHRLFTSYSPQQLELAPKTIRRVAPFGDPRMTNDSKIDRDYGIIFGAVLNRSGGYSYSSGFMPLRDSTIADQPVYENGFGYPAHSYVAVSVLLPERNKGPEASVPTFWFRLPETIPVEAFSDWLPSVSMESATSRTSGNRVWYGLTYRGDLPIYPISAEPPKIRVTSLRSRTKHDDPTTDSLPALTTARMNNKAASVYEFVEKSTEAIPKCD